MAFPLVLAKLIVRLGIAPYLPAIRRLLDGNVGGLPYLSDRLLGAPVAELGSLAAALESSADDDIDLSQGAPQFDDLPSMSGRWTSCRHSVWPPVAGLPELRQAVACKLQLDNRLAVDPHREILITAGVLGAVHTAFDTFINAGDRVVLTDPTSPLYPLAARTRRAKVRWLPTWVEEGRTRFRLDRLARALRGAKMMVVTSPGNPTGGVVSPEDLEQVAWWARQFDVLLLADEAFERFRYDDESVSLAALPAAAARTLTTGSVSKGHGLAAARVGWLAGPRGLVRPCLATAALRSPFVPTLCQQTALAALRAAPAAFAPLRDALAARRQYAWERLRAMGLNPAWPAGAFFFWLPVWPFGQTGRAFAEALLRTKKVRLTPGDLFGPSGAGYVRLSYAAPDGRLHEGLHRLAEFVEGVEAAGTARRAA